MDPPACLLRIPSTLIVRAPALDRLTFSCLKFSGIHLPQNVTLILVHPTPPCNQSGNGKLGTPPLFSFTKYKGVRWRGTYPSNYAVRRNIWCTPDLEQKIEKGFARSRRGWIAYTTAVFFSPLILAALQHPQN